MAEFDSILQPSGPATVPPSDQAPDWLLALLDEATPPVPIEAAMAASRSFPRDDHARARHEDEAAPLAPQARAMLGWTDPRPDAADAFAARLMAAFQSGALDVRPRMVSEDVVRPAMRPRASSSAEEPAKPQGPRTSMVRAEPKYRQHPAPSASVRPFTFPW